MFKNSKYNLPYGIVLKELLYAVHYTFSQAIHLIQSSEQLYMFHRLVFEEACFLRLGLIMEAGLQLESLLPYLSED